MYGHLDHRRKTKSLTGIFFFLMKDQIYGSWLYARFARCRPSLCMGIESIGASVFIRLVVVVFV